MPLFNPTTRLSQFYPWPRDLLFEGEKEALYKYAKDSFTILEIGVFEGASAAVLKKALYEYHGTLFLVDPFVPDSMNSKIKARKWMAKLKVYFTDFFKGKKVHWIFKYSTEISVKEKVFDFIFIDGDHTIKGVKKDFFRFNSSLKIGGIIAFHDSVKFSFGGHPGPMKIRELILSDFSHKFKLIDTVGTISFFKRIF